MDHSHRVNSSLRVSYDDGEYRSCYLCLRTSLVIQSPSILQSQTHVKRLSLFDDAPKSASHTHSFEPERCFYRLVQISLRRLTSDWNRDISNARRRGFTERFIQVRMRHRLILPKLASAGVRGGVLATATPAPSTPFDAPFSTRRDEPAFLLFKKAFLRNF